ncbi:MAG: hypothetical protein ABSA93_00915 [Streptosporangiaceae bacterium]|jgi:hypothetical protein
MADGPLHRVRDSVGGAEVVDRLSQLSGSDFTTLMLEVARRRAARETPASVLRRYRTDRFSQPGRISYRKLLRAETLIVDHLPDDTKLVTLAPVVPLATHSALDTVSQNKVVTAMRACEVAADPTNALALEAALRRQHDRDQVAKLAGIQRVLRAQRFPAPYQAHFSLFGMVTGGRDIGDRRFDIGALNEHLKLAVSVLRDAGAGDIDVALTPLSPTGELISDAITVPTRIDADRQSGYYEDLCFKIDADGLEVGDGGFTDWTRRLTSNHKERLLISCLGVDRLAVILGS